MARLLRRILLGLGLVLLAVVVAVAVIVVTMVRNPGFLESLRPGPPRTNSWRRALKLVP